MAGVGRTTDAIRYMLLGKLAPGVRHKILGGVQAVQLTAELCSRKLQTSRNPAEIDVELGKIKAQAIEVATACRSLVDWLRPDDSSCAPFGETLDHCIRIASDDWTLRGIEAQVHVSAPARAAIVSRPVVCELVSAAVLTLIDLHSTALDLELDAEFVEGQVVLTVKARETPRQAALPLIPVGGKLDWQDVLLLAEAHRVKCVFDAAQASITLHFAQYAGAIRT